MIKFSEMLLLHWLIFTASKGPGTLHPRGPKAVYRCFSKHAAVRTTTFRTSFGRLSWYAVLSVSHRDLGSVAVAVEGDRKGLRRTDEGISLGLELTRTEVIERTEGPRKKKRPEVRIGNGRRTEGNNEITTTSKGRQKWETLKNSRDYHLPRPHPRCCTWIPCLPSPIRENAHLSPG